MCPPLVVTDASTLLSISWNECGNAAAVAVAVRVLDDMTGNAAAAEPEIINQTVVPPTVVVVVLVCGEGGGRRA